MHPTHTWQDGSSDARPHHAGRAQGVNVSIQAIQQAANKSGHPLSVQYVLCVNSYCCKHEHPVSVYSRTSQHALLSLFHVSLLMVEEKSIFFWKITWSYPLINTWLWGLFVQRCWHTAVKDCLVMINGTQSGCCAVASLHPGVSMEIIFISWNWYPLASYLSAFLCTCSLIKYTRWICAGHVIRSWLCLRCLFLHCIILLIGSELWK